MTARPLVLIVTGATAAGKTDLVLELARRLPVDIISADAAQVWRGMDIGTAKPDADTLRRFPHRLVDIRDPGEAYSAAEFARDAAEAVDEALARGRLPVVCGGTMFYLAALTGGLSDLPVADPPLREEILDWARRAGWPALHRRLAEIDPVLAGRIGPGDRQRLQRAHEIHRATGRPPSSVMAESAPRPPPWDVLRVALFHPDRGVLHRRIEARFAAMVERGLVAEVESLRHLPGVGRDSPSMRTVGYRQALEYLSGECDHAAFVARAVSATRQLAKRQLTWLRATSGLVWLDAGGRAVLDALVHLIEDGPARAARRSA